MEQIYSLGVFYGIYVLSSISKILLKKVFYIPSIEVVVSEEDFKIREANHVMITGVIRWIGLLGMLFSGAQKEPFGYILSHPLTSIGGLVGASFLIVLLGIKWPVAFTKSGSKILFKEKEIGVENISIETQSKYALAGRRAYVLTIKDQGKKIYSNSGWRVEIDQLKQQLEDWLRG